MVAVLSRFRVANGMTAAVKQAFGQRPHLVERAAGFLRMDVLSPRDQPDEIWLLTYWTDEASFQAWHHSAAHHEAHRAIPRGLRLDPTATQVRYLEHICS
jgi:heme oxygenase (mycobilin-producing)